MAGKLSGAAVRKLANIEELQMKLQKIHGLVELFATAKANQEALAFPVGRAFGTFKRELMGAGFDSLSQNAGSMEMAAGRGTAPQSKARILREGVASIRFQLEMEQRGILSEEKEKQEKEAEEKGKPVG